MCLIYLRNLGQTDKINELGHTRTSPFSQRHVNLCWEWTSTELGDVQPDVYTPTPLNPANNILWSFIFMIIIVRTWCEIFPINNKGYGILGFFNPTLLASNARSSEGGNANWRTYTWSNSSCNTIARRESNLPRIAQQCTSTWWEFR